MKRRLWRYSNWALLVVLVAFWLATSCWFYQLDFRFVSFIARDGMVGVELHNDFGDFRGFRCGINKGGDWRPWLLPQAWYPRAKTWIACLPLWIPIALAAAPLALTRWRAVPPGHCSNCRYDLTGCPPGVCPECGARVS